MIDKDKVIALLGSGVSPTQTAAAVGCDVSYISQLLADENIAMEIAEKRTVDLLKYKGMDEKYDDMESRLLDRLSDIIPCFTKSDQIIRALTFLNGAKRKAAAGIQGDLQSGQVVKLNLPAVTINNYKITMQGGMVEVGGRSLMPMSSDLLMKTLENKDVGAKHAEKEIQELARKGNAQKLPSSDVINENSV